MKRGIAFLCIMLLMMSSLVLAEDSEDVQGEFSTTAGLTPDSPFYFLDELFEASGTQNPKKALKLREEKLLEAEYLINKGDLEAAKEALGKASIYSTVLEKEVSPELERQTLSSSKAVQELLATFNEEELEDLNDLIEGQLEQEEKIAVAAQISSQIQKLCLSLAELDPVQYAETCKTSGEDPKWLQDLDADLSADQEKEAKEFAAIMMQCFDNPEKCRCSDISVKSFADMCSEVAPLAAACEGGDESACTEMDEFDMDEMMSLLPDYLQIVLHGLESQNEKEQLDPECKEAGLDTWGECDLYRFEMEAPEECLAALEAGDLVAEGDQELWRACDEIMFSEHGPDVCVETGVSDPEECAKLDFETNAPQECLDAGIDGSDHDAWRDCEEIVQSIDHGMPAPVNFDCVSIEDPTERLACYDGALEYVDEYYYEDGVHKIHVCHKPGTNAQKTIEIDENGLSGHLGHGDYEGECSDTEYEVENDYHVGVPGVCEEAGISDHDECDAYMEEIDYENNRVEYDTYDGDDVEKDHSEEVEEEHEEVEDGAEEEVEDAESQTEGVVEEHEETNEEPEQEEVEEQSEEETSSDLGGWSEGSIFLEYYYS